MLALMQIFIKILDKCARQNLDNIGKMKERKKRKDGKKNYTLWFICRY